jgi:dihydroorotase
VNPPLRSEVDRRAVCAGLKDGTLDSIATDHAPHASQEKEVEFDRAPFGLVGLETVVPLTFDRLVRPGILSLSQAVAALATNPGKVLRGLGRERARPAAEVHPLIGTLRVGAPADVSVVNPEQRLRVEATRLYSKSKNTPFDGWELTGAPVLTMVGGRVVMRDGVPIRRESD